MDILILGNGFDLAHDLKTKYSDFLGYCKEKYSITKNVGVDNSNNFLFENVWVKHFLNKTLEGDNWIDLEKEIYNVIVKLSKLPYFKIGTSYENYEKVRFRISKYYMDFNFDNIKEYFNKPESVFVENCYNENIKYFISFLYNQLRHFVDEFEKYLIEEVNTKTINKKFILPIKNQGNIRIISFNYTNTFERLYDSKSIYADNKPKYVYIHGKINDHKNAELVLGTETFDNEQVSVEFNIFKKHNQRHRYGTIDPYQELLKELKDKRKIIKPTFHVIGHSLDNADHNILRHIFRAKEDSTIKIYYHNQEALKRMQDNIDLIIGEDEVIEKVKFIKQDDLKRGILIPQEEPVLVEN